MNHVTVSSSPAKVTLHYGQPVKVTLRYDQKGERGVGISSVALDEQAHLIVTYDDGKTQDAGAALGDVTSIKDGIDSSYRKIKTSEANVTKLEASTKTNAEKAQQALQNTQSASASGVNTINALTTEKMTYMANTFNSLLTQAKANIDQWERDAEDKIHTERTYSLEQIKTAHDDAMVDIERSVNKAEAWAVSETTPDREPDFESPTGLTQSSRSWAMYSKKKVQEAADTLSGIKYDEANVSSMKNDVEELLRRTQASEANAKASETNAENSYNKTANIQGNFQAVLDTAKASETAAKASEMNAAASASTATAKAETATTQANNAKTSATNSANSASASAASASNAKTSETNAEASETASKKWAISETSPDGGTDTDSSTGKTQSSRTWALESKSSAESASASAITATTQASSATASANSANTSATSASNSATSAASSATSASASASSAASSAASASDSKDKASEYKTSASGSATAAASSASSASTSAANAKASMNTANTAASSASTSATNSSTSASNASKSEVAAKAAQAAAEKARDDANSAVAKLTGAMKYAGQVDNYSDLADVTKNKGDVWNIVNADSEHGIKAGDNVAWNGTDWDNLSGVVDLSAYAEKVDYQKVITSATANGATITFNHKDGTTSTATVNNVASATAATNDAEGQKIDTTYEKIADASNVHTFLQNSINDLSTGKQDKLTFDSTPTDNSSNPVTSDGIKTALDTKLDKTGTAVSASKLKTARTISLMGNVTGSTSFDGSGDVSINTTVNDSKHAVSATKLSTARTVQTNLASTSSASFDGSANITPGVSGILPVANGGTGQSNLDKVNVGGAGALNSWANRPTTANNTFNDAKVRYYLATSEMATGKPPSDGYILHLPWDSGSYDWDAQLFVNCYDGTVATRAQDGSADWSKSTGWKTLAFAADVPKNNGTGATGTWGISISGTAAKATADASGNNIANTYATKNEIDGILKDPEDWREINGMDFQMGRIPDYRLMSTTQRGERGVLGFELLAIFLEEYYYNNLYANKEDTYTKTETENKIKELAPTPFNSDKHLVFPSGAEMWVE